MVMLVWLYSIHNDGYVGMAIFQISFCTLRNLEKFRDTKLPVILYSIKSVYVAMCPLVTSPYSCDVIV